MKKQFLLLVVSLSMVALVSACSSSGKKDVVDGRPVVDASADSAHATVDQNGKVFDGGKYDQGQDFSDIQAHGGKGGTVIPEEKFYSVDREKNAPVGKVLYVLTEDDPAKCVLGKFTLLQGKKKLIVYSKSPVPTNYCIYQKQFSNESEGFSVWVKDGGMCKPSVATVVEEEKRKVSTVASTTSYAIPFAYCSENTISYGSELARKQGGNPKKN